MTRNSVQRHSRSGSFDDREQSEADVCGEPGTIGLARGRSPPSWQAENGPVVKLIGLSRHAALEGRGALTPRSSFQPGPGVAFRVLA